MREVETQIEVARRFGAMPDVPPSDLKVGIARNVLTGLQPINALRHPPTGDTSGWYVWAGEEFSQASDFFVPLHIAHLGEWCPAIVPYLGLPPGWRVLLAPGYEDVWTDDSLLQSGPEPQ
jgi:hypothetical protein